MGGAGAGVVAGVAAARGADGGGGTGGARDPWRVRGTGGRSG